MRQADPLDNLHTVYMNAEILCVRCKACDRRNAISMGRRGDMTKLSVLKFKCKSCGGQDVDLSIPVDYSDAMRFLKELE